MALMQRVERKFGKYIPENITKILLGGQILSYILVYTQPQLATNFFLSGSALFQGEIWRLVTFLFAPLSESIFIVAFAWYFFYLLGTALENQWGSFRYFLYLFISYVATVLFSLLFPNYPISNTHIFTSLFLAFAHLYPNFQLLLFFIIPVKVKWLGYFAWLGILMTFILGPLSLKILTLLSLSSYFLFFWNDLRYTILVITKGLTGKTVAVKGKPLHICAVCSKNEKDNPDMEIRYCKQCFPETCYCGDHIKNHQHMRAIN